MVPLIVGCVVAEEVSEGLGERGEALFEVLSDGNPARDVLALQAARLADRLDEMDRIIHGEGVVNLMRFRVEDAFTTDDEKKVSIKVTFSHVLDDARKQSLALSQIVHRLGIPEQRVQAEPKNLPDNVFSLSKMREQAQKNKGA